MRSLLECAWAVAHVLDLAITVRDGPVKQGETSETRQRAQDNPLGGDLAGSGLMVHFISRLTTGIGLFAPRAAVIHYRNHFMNCTE